MTKRNQNNNKHNFTEVVAGGGGHNVVFCGGGGRIRSYAVGSGQSPSSLSMGVAPLPAGKEYSMG